MGSARGLWTLLLAAVHIGVANAGYCVQPPRNSLTFCNFVTYKVYVILEVVPEEYWFELDRRAELLTEDWNLKEDVQELRLRSDLAEMQHLWRCPSQSVQTNVHRLPGHLRARPPDPSTVNYYGGESQTWKDQYSKVTYDAYTKSYRCEANHRLEDGKSWGFLWMGNDCTSTAPSLSSSASLALAATLAAVLLASSLG
eukprot:CAMPEP_0177726886 /NCGR_PEP_ID=MMETSP0484_2-20121128/20017_1 /TAXON_ID=354590 /ORGANISM="Rhodomonas lens, Strain RHODO" /LENGTH=197 /DNA_ID=CAMNT_0019239483 /DNA_START=166 /DNA_END=760 /DNA_ORIENTATION=-